MLHSLLKYCTQKHPEVSAQKEINVLDVETKYFTTNERRSRKLSSEVNTLHNPNPPSLSFFFINKLS